MYGFIRHFRYVFLGAVLLLCAASEAYALSCSANNKQQHLRRLENDWRLSKYLNPVYVACEKAYKACESQKKAEPCNQAKTLCHPDKVEVAQSCESSIQDDFCKKLPDHDGCKNDNINRTIVDDITRDMNKYFKAIDKFNPNATTLETALAYQDDAMKAVRIIPAVDRTAGAIEGAQTIVEASYGTYVSNYNRFQNKYVNPVRRAMGIPTREFGVPGNARN